MYIYICIYLFKSYIYIYVCVQHIPYLARTHPSLTQPRLINRKLGKITTHSPLAQTHYSLTHPRLLNRKVGIPITHSPLAQTHPMLGGWVNPHREQQTIPQGQTSIPPTSFSTSTANGQSAPRLGSARGVGRGAGSHTPSTASEYFSLAQHISHSHSGIDKKRPTEKFVYIHIYVYIYTHKVSPPSFIVGVYHPLIAPTHLQRLPYYNSIAG